MTWSSIAQQSVLLTIQKTELCGKNDMENCLWKCDENDQNDECEDILGIP